MKKKVWVGLSGGVDSSVAAKLLLDQGYEVTGVTLKLWSGALDQKLSEGCGSEQSIKDAAKVAEKLGIRHIVLDGEEAFSKQVVSYFTDTYLKAETPNPCIRCNREIKFGWMLNEALKNGADYIATGHYAQIAEENGRTVIKRSKADRKDQTYVLYELKQEQLRHILMPLWDYTKEEIRAIAEEAGLAVAHKKDSQEICFIPDNDYAAFVKRQTGHVETPGNFVDEAGEILGTHRGLLHYTVGQRKGLGVAFGKPMYVLKLDPEKNEVVLGESGSEFFSSLVARDLNWIAVENLSEPLRLTAKVRYGAKDAPCTVRPFEENGQQRVEVIFDTPQRAVTPGQGVVFYLEDTVFGGGTIMYGRK